MFQLKRDRETWIDSERDVEKSILLLMPKDLINQWIKTIDLVTSKTFDVYKYHNDSRRPKSVVNKKYI